MFHKKKKKNQTRKKKIEAKVMIFLPSEENKYRGIGSGSESDEGVDRKMLGGSSSRRWSKPKTYGKNGEAEELGVLKKAKNQKEIRASKDNRMSKVKKGFF